MKEKSSSVFVSFGSKYFLFNEEMVEIAHWLELSKVNFIWVVSFPKGERRLLRLKNPYLKGFLGRSKAED